MNKKRAFMNYIGAVLSGLAGGCAYAGVVLFIMPMCEKLGCTATEFSIVFTAIGLGMMAGGFFIGKLFAKFSPKYVGLVGSVGTLVFYASMAVGNSVQLVWATAFIFGVTFGMSASILFQVVVTNWFNRGRGMLVSIYTVICNLGGMIIPIVIAQLMSLFGAEKTVLIFGIICTAIPAVCCISLVTSLPSAYGMQAVDIGKEKASKDGNEKIQNSQTDYNAAMPASKIARTSVFIMVIACIIFLVTANTMYYNNSTNIYQNLGLTYEDAAYCISIASFAAMVTVFIFGVLCDKLGAKITIALYSVVAAAGMFIAVIFSGWAAAIALAVFSTFAQCGDMYAPMVLPKLYGGEKSVVLLGWAGIASGVGSMIGAPIAAGIFDATGPFNVALIVAGVTFIVAAIMTLGILSNKTSERIREMDAQYIQKAPEAK